MTWTSYIYGEGEEIATAIMQWAKESQLPAKEISLTSVRLPSDESYGVQGTKIDIRAGFNDKCSKDLLEKLSALPGVKVFLLPTNSTR